jgi:PAS domain S-box-containing protein
MSSPEVSKINVGEIYSTIVEMSSSPVFVLEGPEMIVTVANQATLEAWGKDKSVIGKRFQDALPEMEGQPFFELLTRVYTTGVTYHANYDRADFLKDGRLQTFYFSFSYQPLKNTDGTVWGVLCTATDVTELVRANQRREESEQRFRHLILKAPVALGVLKGDDYVVDLANERMLAIWGTTKEQVLNKPIFVGLPEARGQGIEELLLGVYKTGVPLLVEEREVTLPGSAGLEKKILNFVYSPYYESNDQITGIMVSAIDVTELVQGRRRVEETNKQLELTQQRLELALQVGRLGAYEKNLTTGEFNTSGQFRRNLGLPADKPIDYQTVINAVLPEYQEDLARLQTEYQEKDAVFNIEVQVRWPSGSTHWLRVTGKTTVDSNNARVVSGVTQDITEQKHLQQEKDDFISIASHELKTPITSLKASIQLLSRLKNDRSAPIFPDLIDQASTSLTRVSHLINDLLNASKMMEGQLELNKSEFVMAKLIEESLFHAKAARRMNIRIEGDTALKVMADPLRIDQVIVNFVNNALKYAPNSEVIRIVIEPLSEGAMVSVIDQGPGIPEDKLPHLFKRYFRADEKGQPYSGIGLGLYICSEIIKRHHGKVGVESEQGKGSRFWFLIPYTTD